MSLRIAFIDAAPTMRMRVADALVAAFPGSEIDSFVPPDYLPEQNFDWSLFDAIVVGEFSDDEAVLPFVRSLALNPTRRPVIYLCHDELDTPTSVSLKLLAIVKLPRSRFRDSELISAIIFARRDRGLLVPTASEPSTASSGVSATTVAEETVRSPPSPHIVLMDGSAGFRRVIAHFLLSVWPAATVEEIDPFSQTMRGVGISFGTHGDILILGGIGTRNEALSALARLQNRERCPPIVLIVTRDLAAYLDELKAAGAAAVLFKDALSRNALCVAVARATGLAEAAPVADAPTGNFSFLLDGERYSLEIGGFRCVATISANAMAQVFYAERLPGRRRAVIKILTASPHHDLKGIETFCSRYRFFSGLAGRSVVRYLDAGVAGQWPYVALEYLSAGDLRSRMRIEASSQSQARVMFRLAAALSTIHGGAFVHLDLKPENIFFRDNGELVLIDFNIATRFGGVGRNRFSGEVLGTPAYMSPEQGQGLPLDGRSDLYSAGVVFYEMLTGELPYSAKSDAEIIFRHIHDEVPLLPKRLRHFQPIIDGLMAKDREQRFASGADLAFALQPFLNSDITNTPT